MKQIALIPAYQPNHLLIELLEKLYQTNIDIVVVDDGSDDSTIFEQAKLYAHVLVHRTNKGKGASLKDGLSYIQQTYEQPYVVVTMDADGQHSVQDAQKILSLAMHHSHTLILGSRKFDKDVPLRSQLGNTITRYVYKLTTRVTVFDTQTGLRAFDSSLIPFLLQVQGDRYEYEMNVLLSCAKQKIAIQEEWIETIYIDDNASSHFDTVKDSLSIYKEILKFSASSFISFLLDYGLFTILTILSISVPIANVIARIISASINYNINKRMVFQSDAKQSLLRYSALAICILLGNTVVLSFFVSFLHMNAYVSKLLTEILFFILSWFVQRTFIFTKTANGGFVNEKICIWDWIWHAFSRF